MSDPTHFMPAVGGFLYARAKTYLPEIIGTTISGTGAVTAWQAQAQWFVSISAGLVGMVAGLLTIRSLLRKDRKQ